MPEFKQVQVAATPYLYVSRSAAMAPDEIGAAMGEALGTVMGFMRHHGVPPAGPPMAVYHDHAPDRLRFRAGFPVAAGDAAAAEGEVRADATPAGTALHFTHVGPYATLRDDYGPLMAHIEAAGLQIGGPTWEVYIDDRADVPEERLRTEVYVAIA